MSQEEREISIIDLLLYICSKYKQIIVVALIFMIIFGCLGYFKQNSTNAIDKETKIELAVENIELTLDEEHLLDVYYSYKDVYEIQKEKNINNVAMTADPDNTCYSTLTYIISDTYMSEMIARTYESKIVKTQESFGSLYEMALVEVRTPDTAMVISSDLSKEKSPQTMLRITVYGIDERDCSINIDLVKAMIDDLYEQIKEVTASYKITLVNDNIVKAIPEVLKVYQNAERQKEYQAYSALNGIKNAMPDDVKKYITTVDDFEKVKNGSLISTAIKFAIIGMMLAVFIMVCLHAVLYILNSSIRFEDDLEKIYDINVLGRVSAFAKKKGLSKFIEKLRRRKIHIFEEEQVIDMIVAGIRVYGEKKQIKEVYVTGGSMGDREKYIFEAVSKKLQGISVLVGNPMLYYADALEKSAETGNVILVEKVGESKYDELYQELKKCQEHNINVLGMVVVE